jgi:RNA polymerase sigma factor (sigma-70 family)
MAATNSNPSAFDPSGDEPSPEAVVAFLDLLEHFMGDLRENDRRVLEMRLQGWTQDEIARELDCTERTVRRTLDRIRSLAEDQNIREQLME